MQLNVTSKATTNLFFIIYLLLGHTLLFLQITLFHRICYTGTKEYVESLIGLCKNNGAVLCVVVNFVIF